VDWQYLIANTWSIGFGICLGKTTETTLFICGEHTLQLNFTFSPTINFSRFYAMNERGSFALAHQISDAKVATNMWLDMG